MSRQKELQRPIVARGITLPVLNIGREIHLRRVALGLTLNELAALIGIRGNNLSMMEFETRSIPMKYYERAFKVLEELQEQRFIIVKVTKPDPSFYADPIETT